MRSPVARRRARRGRPARVVLPRAIELAEEVAATSIAFPAISCGIYRYPAEEAVEIAVGTVAEMLPQAPNLARVVFACFSPDIYDLYRARLART